MTEFEKTMCGGLLSTRSTKSPTPSDLAKSSSDAGPEEVGLRKRGTTYLSSSRNS